MEKGCRNRIILLLMLGSLLIGSLGLTALAAEAGTAEGNVTVIEETMTYINPLYEDVLTEADLNTAAMDGENGIATVSDTEIEYYTSLEEAAEELRQQMVSREEVISIPYVSDSFDGSIMESLLVIATEHTGVATGGDYLKFQYGGCTAHMEGFVSGETYYLTITYTMTYYTTAEQEAEVTATLESVMGEMDLDSKTDYEKICAIYDYICENVTYDYDNLNDSDYKLKYTAYAALVNKTAVCQGYAVLFYRMALEAGVDARVISGTSTSSGEGHAWNIVQLGDCYYNVDATWDASYVAVFNSYNYFLRCDENFEDHSRGEDYASEEFYEAYPMGTEDYDPSSETETTYIASGVDNDLTWSISSDSVLTISGQGDYDTSGFGGDWRAYSDYITSAVVEVSGITSTRYMFYHCTKLETIDFGTTDTSEVTDMRGMFTYCYNLQSLDLSGFDTTQVTDMSWMFGDCNNLTSLDISGFDTSSVVAMEATFYNCNSLTSLDVSGFNTANVTSMATMFSCCDSLTSLDVSNFDTGKVTSMGSMFYGCSGLTSLDVSGFNTANVTIMSDMFDGCSGLANLDVSGFDTGKVTDMYGMFYGCSGLTSLDVSSFDTANVTMMGCMFQGCSGLTSLDVSGFDTENVTVIGGMFCECTGLTSLDVSGFDTSNVTSMGGMFQDCSGLTSLDVSNFNTSNAMDMYGMFYGCSGLTSLDLSSFDTSSLVYAGKMFEGCSDLITLTVPGNWSVSTDLPSVERTYWMDENGDVCEAVASGLSEAMTYIRCDEEEDVEDVEDLFSDVVSGSWYVSAIQYVYDSGLMSGKGDGLFDPTGKITRAEFVTTLYSMQGKPEVSYETTFSDVASGQWYTNPIMWASKNEVVSGYTNGKFGVSDAITREQLALMLYKYATVVCGYEDNAEAGVLEQFADADSASSWAVHALEWAVTNGVMSGKGENLDPSGNATRAECAAMLRSFCVNVAGQ